ncbi:zinc ribbon domain-containing protein [Candidatus Halobonum tyrrellensis]|uniref:DUF7575 domain-containing protein n=1 Tax=Candidatus Halobonum tyrrellensis G22 TaxID=1324957 RepID=V4HE76_9EURY|nr:zinc ribbon domain-containing protein [Candidatus Halobonum tyrrellensis]ESP88980.1 hypothetical protein K933_06008 [Candidatus Halobonum tyrrellensis G22]
MSRSRTGPRPWLAALLALVVTGAGHAYLRRWARALGWFLFTFAAVATFVPEEAIQATFSGGTPADPLALAPPALVVFASAADAYLLARRARGRPVTGDPNAAAAAVTGREEGGRCPNCGHDIDADMEFDFCPWCSAELGPRADADDR